MASKQKSDRKLEVIGAGLGRTGTMSLKVALEQLGYGTCYHMVEVFQHANDKRIFQDAHDGKPVNWHAMFEDRGYYACVDYPACMYFEQIMKEYPNAKILLSVRDPEQWHESVMQTIWKANQLMSPTHKPYFPFPFAPKFDFRGLHDLDNFKGSGKPVSDRANALREFNKWTEHVKKIVPKERLIIFDVKQGWEPLCKFLGRPIPSTPFPHVNDAENFQKRIQMMQTMQQVWSAGCVLTIAGVAYYVTTKYGRTIMETIKGFFE